MKRFSPYLTLIFVTLLVTACGGKKHEITADNDKWPEMDEFHNVMADSFHPFKDSANLEPAKANAAAMAKMADKWASAPIPEKVDNDEVKTNLNQLKNDATLFVQIVQEGDSAKIGTSLTALHDQFHKLQETWYSAHGKDGHEEDHNHEH